MNIRKLLLPSLIAATLAAPLASAQQPSRDAAKADKAEPKAAQQGQAADGAAAKAAEPSRAEQGKAKKKADPTIEPEEEDD